MGYRSAGGPRRGTGRNVASTDNGPPPIDFTDPRNPPPIGAGAGNQWIFDPTYGMWTVDSAPAPPGGGGDGASAAASLRGHELDYQLGLKGVEVDWARVGIDREQIGINKQLARVQQGELAEATRANKVMEAEKARQRALDAASNAMSAYMTGTQLADARRLASFQEARSLLPHLVDPNQQYQAGYEPGGPLATATERFGLPAMTPQKVQKKTMRPGDLAKAPTNQQIGGGIMSGIQDIRKAGKAK